MTSAGPKETMLTDGLHQRAKNLVLGRFLKKAANPGTQERIESDVEAKLARIESIDDENTANLRKLVHQVSDLWVNRDSLSRYDLLLVAAALLYFLSPFDAVPDVIPFVGYTDDVLVLVWVIRKVLSALKTKTDALVDEWVAQRVDHAFGKAEEVAQRASNRAVMVVAISLWGATTTAALSLAVRAIAGSYPEEWAAYISVSAAMVMALNAATGLEWWRRYKGLDGKVQDRIRSFAESQLKVRYAAMLGAPVLFLLALGLARVFVIP